MRKWLLLFCLCLASCGEPSLRLGVTTTFEDSGLLRTITHAFYQSSGIRITPIVAGSGQLFSIIERGDVDIAMTHEPIGEKDLLARHIIQSRTPIFYNYFLLVGPYDNPANISNDDDLQQAFTTLINSKRLFTSRSDNSGTHRAEENLWGLLGDRPTAENTIKTGTGMASTLRVSAERQAYTLVDTGTWSQLANTVALIPIWQVHTTRDINNTNTYNPVADSGHPLYNEYSLLTINPAINEDTMTQKNQMMLFKQWLLNEGKKIIQQHPHFDTIN